MSFGRHACRHALKPPSTPSLDHLWISDDLLTTTFRRFANGQRRNGSCVPGPLEARRRLAKRRNTALAGIGGGPVEDIACLFGRNGREHMKWTDHQWQRTQPDNLGSNSYARGYSEIPLPFYDHNPEPLEPLVSHDNPPTPKMNSTNRTRALQILLERDDCVIEDARDFVRQLEIDLQREPEFSRQIFDHLLERSPRDLSQPIKFLEDPFLNTWGSGNYLAAVEYFVRHKAKRASRTAILNAVARGLELGLVPTDELCLIVQTLPKILVERNKALGEWDQKTLLKHYRSLWKAVGRCNILGYRDLDMKITDCWLEEVMRIGCVRFAEEIVIATHDASSDTAWPSVLVTEHLNRTDKSDAAESISYASVFLDRIDADLAAKCIVDVTEYLSSASSNTAIRQRSLERWRECLSQVSNIVAISNSQTWVDMPLAYMHSSEEQTEISLSSLSVQSQIVLRLWALRTLSRTLGPMYNQAIRATDLPICFLLNLYETSAKKTDGSFLSDFMAGVQRLDLPYNSLLLLAVDLKLRKLTSKTTRQTLQRLETGQTSLADIWTDHSTYRGVRGLFHGTFEQMFRKMDLTSPDSVQECLHLARTGDSKHVWSVLRLLSNHIPFQLCLHKAWEPIPHSDEKALVRYHPGPRDSQCPDPYAAVDFVHQLAVVFSCCNQLTPSRSFHLIHWLYGYLRRHGGPVHPPLVRAMYHAGVVRYRREGRRVSPTQYEYILWIARKFEGPDVVRELTSEPTIARGRPIQQEDYS